ncbi:MAG TPA: hypothetical protein VGT41_02000 [Candidatus Babeliales bacterium]|nr:hypothetical protein [Candidatus Babeliales bacterium]
MNNNIIFTCICCFCEGKISCDDSNVCALRFTSNIDKEESKQHKSSLCCHLECLKKQTTPIIAEQLSHFACDHT